MIAESTTANEGYAIKHDLTISAPISRIFANVTNPEHLENWWPLRCSGIPEVGSEYNFFFSEAYDWYGRVIKVEEDRSFHISMTRSDPDWDPTSFGFDLEPDGDAVTLRFWHIGWPECNAHFRGSSFCWGMLLNGLKNYSEKGIIIPFDERE